MVTRRDIIRSAGAGAFAAALPSFVFAKTESTSRFVLVILRGAADGMSIAAPYGDSDYPRIRGDLALSPPGQDGGALKLDGMFGLHPSLAGVFEEYEKNQALVVHAIASPYRERSHFDGQDVLENGGANAGLLRDGWLNRALGPPGSSLGNESAIAMAVNTPLVLRGENEVTSWAPSQLPDAEESTIRRLQDLYADDEFFATRLAQAIKSQEIADGEQSMDRMRRRSRDAKQVKNMMLATSRFLTADGGPRIAVVETGGWDTHQNQGNATGALANRLAGLDAGLVALRDGLGSTWSDTVVAVVTEFGRTAHINGTRGTDHGTATAAILLGGAVNGGRVVADWPGLGKSDLYEGRDLTPTADTRGMFKGILADHLAVPGSVLENSVFPNSADAPQMRDLIRA
jgi:uncharacterized protein (DUF1501 family)